MIRDMMRRMLADWELEADGPALERFELYYRLLEERNRHMNLVGDASPETVCRRHFLDSLAPVRFGGLRSGSLIDIGSGAGFPGLPIKILCPDIEVTLLDAQRKRTAFLSEAVAALGLEGIHVVTGRAEEAARDAAHRGRYDAAVSRAVSRLNELLELSVPFLRIGGQFFAMKSGLVGGEAEEAESAMRELAVSRETITYTNHAVPLVLLRFPKIGETPARYPRRYAQIKKKPL